MADGPTLLELRRIANLPQSEIAEHMQISESAVSQIERRAYVRGDTAQRYQRAVINTVREKAIGGLFGDAMRSIIEAAQERSYFISVVD